MTATLIAPTDNQTDVTGVRHHDTIEGVQAVLWDMDGTLVDSEKLWDISLAALYAELGGELRPEVRTSMVGSAAENTIRIVYTDLGLDHDPRAMAESHRWLHDYTAELFDGGLPWCDGAQELLEALAAEGTPMALVTNTQRFLTEHRHCRRGGRRMPGVGRTQRCSGARRTTATTHIFAGARRCRRSARHLFATESTVIRNGIHSHSQLNPQFEGLRAAAPL